MFDANLSQIELAVRNAGLGSTFSIGIPPKTTNRNVLASWVVDRIISNGMEAKLGEAEGEVIFRAAYKRVPGVKVSFRITIMPITCHGDIPMRFRYHEKGGQWSVEAEYQLAQLVRR